ncbi:adhesion G-protein coupled receptor D2 [Carlito syrichta]|uniref:Adhesion G-protein coupled receptor D2 n=1 Tax=Carlito syrichta TaxID=1868482 RepID=A0A3Q0DQM2_CARSF|nr:adhesion G-protein coupled receptor D2 [Carlito syrichta]
MQNRQLHLALNRSHTKTPLQRDGAGVRVGWAPHTTTPAPAWGAMFHSPTFFLQNKHSGTKVWVSPVNMLLLSTWALLEAGDKLGFMSAQAQTRPVGGDPKSNPRRGRSPGPIPSQGPSSCSPFPPSTPARMFFSVLDEVKISPLRGESQAFKLDWHADVEQLVAGARGPGEQSQPLPRSLPGARRLPGPGEEPTAPAPHGSATSRELHLPPPPRRTRNSRPGVQPPARQGGLTVGRQTRQSGRLSKREEAWPSPLSTQELASSFVLVQTFSLMRLFSLTCLSLACAVLPLKSPRGGSPAAQRPPTRAEVGDWEEGTEGRGLLAPPRTPPRRDWWGRESRLPPPTLQSTGTSQTSPGLQCFPASALKELLATIPLCKEMSSLRDGPPHLRLPAHWSAPSLVVSENHIKGNVVLQKSGVSLGPPPTPQMNQGTLGSQVAPVAPGEVVETAAGVCKFSQQWLSWWQAQESCEQRFGHLALRPLDGVLAPRLHDPVWVGQREASLRRPPQRRGEAPLSTEGPCGSAKGQSVRGRTKCTAGETDILARVSPQARAPPPRCVPREDGGQGGAPAQLPRARACAPPPGGLLFRWDPDALDITPSLLPTVWVRLLRPVPSEECPTWDPGPHTEGSALCLQPRPFLCCYRTETYQRLQDAQSWPHQDIISQVNALANDTVLLPDPLSEAHSALSLAEASSFLSTLERVLAKRTASLGPAALLAVVHFLKRVIALGESEPLTGPWKPLGQGVMSVASLVLEEPVTDAWLCISEVVGGPMALVASVQRLAPLLSTLLTSEQPRMHVQYRHAGLSRVTVIHNWFTSRVFQHTLRGPGLEPLAPGNSEEASRVQRFLSTQVGSAIISSEVCDITREVSTAVTFHLQHQAQSPLFPPHPPSPDTGGSWATTGCPVATLHQDSAVCFCNHSTNFAILLQVYDIHRDPEEESLLKTLSFVGCGVSFCALATTFLLFLAAGVPKSERITVHKNLTFSLACAEGLLMASEWAKTNKVACVAATAAMHFLFLVAFSWMLVEGLLLWNKVVAVDMRPGPRMRLYYAAGWGVPMVIVAITLATSPRDYVATGHCWLNVHTDTIWAFVGPVLFVLTANTCILVRVVMVTVSSSRHRARVLSLQPCLQQQIRIQMWATVKPVLVLLPVLGLTWLVSVLVHLSPAWAYAAVGLNSLQGPSIFLVYAASSGGVRSALQRMTEEAAEVLMGQQTRSRRGGTPRLVRVPATLSDFRLAPAGPAGDPGFKYDHESPTHGGKGFLPQSSKFADSSSHPALGTHGPSIPTVFSSIAELERPAVELTAFKASGTAPPHHGALPLLFGPVR